MPRSDDLGGKVALVTGAGRNIGQAVALKLAGAGAEVAITYQRDEAAALNTCQLVAEGGGHCEAFRMELAEPASIERTVGQIAAELGPVDILANTAAIRPPVLWDDLTAEKWDAVMNVNTRGPFLLSQRVIPHMQETKWGRIMFFGGVGSYIGTKNVVLGASKLALVGMTRSFAKALGPFGITVNVICPGIIDTHHENEELYGNDDERRAALVKIPMGRLGQPVDVANMCLFLATDAASFVSGQEIFVSGGTFPVAI